jgi:hypothetical protein
MNNITEILTGAQIATALALIAFTLLVTVLQGLEQILLRQ